MPKFFSPPSRAPLSWIVCALILSLFSLQGQARKRPRYDLDIPDLRGYRTLAVDLHVHTVFSDGRVWPTTRIDEAWRLGLDAIAITDHIEYLPHKEDIPPKHNRPHQLSEARAKKHDPLLLRGAEITREMPPGHLSAVFLKDVEPLETDDVLEVLKRANQQFAFVMWNHPGWKMPAGEEWSEMHTTLYERNWLHGIEICTDGTYYAKAHQWCLDRDLTMLGNSDIHQPELRLKNTPKNHRTLTFVFAIAKRHAALKAALIQGRTVVWCRDKLIGRQEWLEPLLHACLKVGPIHHRTETAAWLRIRNDCGVNIVLQGTGEIAPARLTLRARSSKLVKLRPGGKPLPQDLPYRVSNFWIAPATGLEVVLPIPP